MTIPKPKSRVEEIEERLDQHDADALGWMSTATPSDLRYLIARLRLLDGIVEAVRRVKFSGEWGPVLAERLNQLAAFDKGEERP